MTGRRGARDADAGIDLSATAGTLHVPSQTSGGRISMAARLSNPIESLINDRPPKEIFAEVDVAIVGSGYGGGIAAPHPPPPGRRAVVPQPRPGDVVGDLPPPVGRG